MRIEAGMVYFSDNSTLVLSTLQEKELLEELQKDDKKIRVKQALKLKEAGFSGKEIIDIIGEIE